MRSTLLLMTQKPASQRSMRDFQILAAQCGQDQALRRRACDVMRLTGRCEQRPCKGCQLDEEAQI